MESGSGKLDVRELIDGQPLGAAQVWMFVLLFAVLALDGLDTQLLSYVAPNIAREWHISMANLGSIFSIGLLGSMCGALLLGVLGDSVGVKRTLVGVTALVGLATLMTGFSRGIGQLYALRFITGFGVGGALPNLIALAAQFAPGRRRATIVTLTGCGFPMGAALGGALSAWVVPGHGWRTAYFVAGALPLLMTPLLLVACPESIPVLLRKANGQLLLRKTMARFFPKTVLNQDFIWKTKNLQAGAPLRILFSKAQRGLTSLLAGIFFLSLLNVYLLSNWLPGLLQAAHSTPRESVIATTCFNLGGLLGGPVLGRLMDRFGFGRALASTYVGGAISIGALAMGLLGGSGLTALALVTGFCVLGGQGALNALPALLYPEEARAAGTGLVAGIGRFGSLLGPLIAGFLLGANWTHSQVLGAAAIPAFGAAMMLLVVAGRRRTAVSNQVARPV